MGHSDSASLSGNLFSGNHLSHCLVYEIPVPMVALEVVCHSLTNYRQQLQRARELGLLEISPEVEEENQLYRVSRILPHIISSIQRPVAPEVYSLYRKAHDKLHDLWGNEENKNKEKWHEIFRLLFANKENTERFRQGFSQILEFPNNMRNDEALESELRQLRTELSENNLYCQLECYLKTRQWRKADEETAWIVYQVMVLKGYKDFIEVYKLIPCNIISTLDQLWVKYSKRRFGFSVQKNIYLRLGGKLTKKAYWSENYNKDIWIKFCEIVGWISISDDRTLIQFLHYDFLPFNIEASEGIFPSFILPVSLHVFNRNGKDYDILNRGYYSIVEYSIRWEELFSRINFCKL